MVIIHAIAVIHAINVPKVNPTTKQTHWLKNREIGSSRRRTRKKKEKKEE